MRLARLLLEAFGPFTGTCLDFVGSAGQPAAGLHLIHGANEAGKSSALRAMTDLRFGIPMRSPDDFVHPYNRMRIVGEFIDDSGARVGLMRRKGQGPTLYRYDLGSGTALEAAPAAVVDALGGGLTREEVEALFGLNHERLRAGGARLLRGEGELGAALFEASAGTQGIRKLLAGLEEDARSLFNPHGRAQKAVINEARQQLEAQRQAFRQAQVRPADWQLLNRAHEQARAKLSDIDRALEALRRQENALTELRTVEPLLREHDQARLALQALAPVPELAVTARDDRLAAEQALRRAAQDLQEADSELQRCSLALADRVIEAPLLAHAQAIERLAAGAEAAARSRLDARQQQLEIEGLEAGLQLAAARIAPGRPLALLLAAAPAAADRIALDRHLAEVARLGGRLELQRSRLVELEAVPEPLDPPAPPAPASRQALRLALAEARALGEVGSRIAEAGREQHRLDARLEQALSDLGLDSIAALRASRPLLDAQVVATGKARVDIDEAQRRLGEEGRRLDTDLKQQRLRQTQLAAAGEVVTADTLSRARAHRDQGWAQIRRIYVEPGVEGAASAPESDPALAEAFEAAQAAADRQADLLRADASRAAGFEECAARIRDMLARQAEIERERSGLHDSLVALQAAWSARLAAAGLPELEPDALREWQSRRATALELAERCTLADAECRQLQARAERAATALRAALAGMGQGSEACALAQLIALADHCEQETTRLETEHNIRALARQEREAERHRLLAQLDTATAELQRERQAVAAWHERLGLAAGSAPETVKARLDELDALGREAGKLAEARLRLASLQATVADFCSQVDSLAARLGEAAPAPTLVQDHLRSWMQRLSLSREQDQLRQALLRDQARAQATRRSAEAERHTHTATLAGLCAAAGVGSVEQLPACEEAASRKRALNEQVAAQRLQLAQASSRSEAELRSQLAGRDALALDGEREHCRAEIARLAEDQHAARAQEEQTRHALEAVDASARAAEAREAMEAAAARFRSAIRPWARLKLAHALLQQALNRFRERAQAPMVAAASTYFALMTGGRYPRLLADDSQERPVLRAERQDGSAIGVEAMSEGTADQLYLALRLAALALRRTSHPPMPLILDDVLMTSDDTRAANVLRALQRFAEGGQVMVFTHHHHLLDLARDTLGEAQIMTHEL